MPRVHRHCHREQQLPKHLVDRNARPDRHPAPPHLLPEHQRPAPHLFNRDRVQRLGAASAVLCDPRVVAQHVEHVARRSRTAPHITPSHLLDRRVVHRRRGVRSHRLSVLPLDQQPCALRVRVDRVARVLQSHTRIASTRVCISNRLWSKGYDPGHSNSVVISACFKYTGRLIFTGSVYCYDSEGERNATGTATTPE